MFHLKSKVKTMSRKGEEKKLRKAKGVNDEAPNNEEVYGKVLKTYSDAISMLTEEMTKMQKELQTWEKSMKIKEKE